MSHQQSFTNPVSLMVTHASLSDPRAQEFEPFHSICEFLSAIHIYADEAKKGKTRYVEATHYCAHVRKGRGPPVDEFTPEH